MLCEATAGPQAHGDLAVWGGAFVFGPAQQQDLQSLLHFDKALPALRNRLRSGARGSFEHGFADGLVASWQRRLDARPRWC